MYDPNVGRWLTEDPIGFRGLDANLYRYVGNSPTNYTDPSGLIIAFGDKDSADDFVGQLQEFGAGSISTYIHNPKSDEFGTPTVYVVIDPRDMEAVFKYADKNFDVTGVRRFGCKDKLTPEQQDVNDRRNNFLVAAGIAGISSYTADPDGNLTGFFRDGVSGAIKSHPGGRDAKVALDLGGEGGRTFGTPGAINVNIQPKNSGDDARKPIPRLFLRPKCDERLPFPDKSIDKIVSQATPISPFDAKEIARLIASGGTITLIRPDNLLTRGMHQAVINAVGSRGTATRMSGGDLATTLINVP